MYKFISKLCLGAASAAGAIALHATPASAAVTDIFQCQSGCVVDPADGWFPQDFTVPTDGHRYRWDFRIENAGGSYDLRLQKPNQVEAYVSRRLADGTFDFDVLDDFDFTFERLTRPGMISYVVGGPKSFDTCSASSPIGVICSAQYIVWGNGTDLEISGSAPFTVYSSITAVPEPAAWAMMIVGFGLAGAAVRRKRATWPAAA